MQLSTRKLPPGIYPLVVGNHAYSWFQERLRLQHIPICTWDSNRSQDVPNSTASEAINTSDCDETWGNNSDDSFMMSQDTALTQEVAAEATCPRPVESMYPQSHPILKEISNVCDALGCEGFNQEFLRLLNSTLIRGKKKLAEQHPLSVVGSTMISCELATSRKRKYKRFKGYHEK